jgi:predicted nucleic acid-binding protein
LSQKGGDFVEHLFNTDFLVSVIVKIEVLGFNDVTLKLKAMEEFVSTATDLPLDEAVTRQTILLRRTYKKLKLGDAIIAATSLVYDLTLITNNSKDFESINGLRLLNPYSY